MSTGLADIRTAFLEYFEKQEHAVHASTALVPLNDPTLLFTNAGMVPFKNSFTGREPALHPRVVSAQKCIRAGGKHNDLDNVGYTARHHTFFEMLGNFSFGDYFKEEAIYYAWHFLTKELKLPKQKLLATIYVDDDEAAMLWKKIAGFTDEKIIRISTADNFWSMGEVGPCGPCSEIFFDHGEGISGGPPGSLTGDGDRFIEIWNLVFMQYDQQADGSRINLPSPSIDTGMGLERIGAILQGKQDNYETDLMWHLMESSADHSGVPIRGKHFNSHRVIADHLRASSFLIADGVLPSNEGRGYVLRRIMRRAMRHAHLLGSKGSLLWKLVPALKMQMAAVYPELERANALIIETLRHEEERFREMLNRGLKLLEDELKALSGPTLSGEIAFKLYDTYGFPLDLTQDALRERGLSVELEGFNKSMAKQKAAARAHWSGSGSSATETIWFDIRHDIGASEFVGYHSPQAEAVITAMVFAGQTATCAKQGDEIAFLVSQTPFYAQSGGQVGDTGHLTTAAGGEVEIIDTQKKLGDMHVHIGRISKGEIGVGETVHLGVDALRREDIRANHSATHLLHEGLRRVLGDHVTQKGSLVTPDGLRFDFSHPKAMTQIELMAVENMVNDIIRKNESVETRVMTPNEAIEAGALALFGEKYGDEVRVLSMGTDDGGGAHHYYSVELCGGTHVDRLGDISMFKIISEGGVASGVRRIEAKTATGARAYMQEQEHLMRETARVLKASMSDVPARVQTLVDDKKRLERELGEAKKMLALSGDQAQSGVVDDVQEIGSIKFIGKRLDGVEAKDLRGLADIGKKKLGSGIVIFISVSEGKASIVVGVTKDLTARFSAVDLVRIGAEKLGGKGGGGRPDMAQAGGDDISGCDAAIEAIKEQLI